ncbi:hypothetical protein WJX74_001294 [Apatococcus lobatus]|uniref:F-box domain-containing protein n=1 Tax=Apatococcus lobatus TaxID=904363 RepID=A0AAW1RBR6_9CHLO
MGQRTLRAQRSARLLGRGLGRLSVCISKRQLRVRKSAAGQATRTKRASRPAKDFAQIVPEALVEDIFKKLSPKDTAACGLVCKQWKAISISQAIWKEHCEELWANKVFLPSLEQNLSFQQLFKALLADSKRTELGAQELCSCQWTFRFKPQAGHYWTSFDPYYTKEGPMMQRQFKLDGSLTGSPAHHPLWSPHWESRWRFTKTSMGKRGHFIKVNHWPALSISRTEDWGWRLENCWVEYRSLKQKHPEAL